MSRLKNTAYRSGGVAWSFEPVGNARVGVKGKGWKVP